MLYTTLSDGKLISREVNPVFDEATDVCVVGLGTAGAVCAISAAENGARVVGIEKVSYIGGTAVGVCDYYFGAAGGISEQIKNECYRRIDSGDFVSSGGREIRENSVSGAVKSSVLLDRALAAGVKIFTKSRLIGVFSDEAQVCGIEFFDGEKIRTLRASVTVDCADGEVCRLLGCDFLGARPSDGHTMRFSHIFGWWNGVHERACITQYDFPEAEREANRTRLILGGILSGGFIKEHYSPLIVWESPVTGLREVRAVECESSYTLSDILAKKPPEKPLYYSFAPLDNANSDDWNETETIQDWKVLTDMKRFGISAGVPMGMLIPKGKKGLLVAGKAMGAGHDLIGCLRMTADIEKCGEAAGVISAAAVREGKDVRDLDYGKITDKLRVTGCRGEENDLGICDLTYPMGNKPTPYKLPENAEELISALSSDEPGPAILSVKIRCDTETKNILAGNLSSENRNLAENCAFALGIAGDTRCLPMLRAILSRPPEYKVHTVKKLYSAYSIGSTFTCGSIKALILVGRLRDKESIPLLEKILKDDGKSYAKSAKRCDLCPSDEDMACRFVGFALGALNLIKSEKEKNDV